MIETKNWVFGCFEQNSLAFSRVRRGLFRDDVKLGMIDQFNSVPERDTCCE